MSVPGADDVYLAFGAVLNTYAEGFSQPITVLGPDSTPKPTSGFWLEYEFFPNTPVEYALENGGAYVANGYAQVGVGYVEGFTFALALEQAQALANAIPRGTALATARVDRTPSILRRVVFDAYAVIPVVFYYRG